jgi:hypothetical protein
MRDRLPRTAANPAATAQLNMFLTDISRWALRALQTQHSLSDNDQMLHAQMLAANSECA